VRSWIVSNKLYQAKLEPILKARNDDGRDENNRNEIENCVLDKLDRFCAIMLRAKTFDNQRVSWYFRWSDRKFYRDQEKLLSKCLYDKFWRDRAFQKRAELYKYIQNEWPELDKKPDATLIRKALVHLSALVAQLWNVVTKS
jgi:hypothetical protein